jgi:hypothetical protein
MSCNHKHADVRELDFDGDFRSSATTWCDEDFWNAAFVHSLEPCESKAAAQRLVMALLHTMLVGLGLDKFVSLVGHRTLAGMGCDILLVYKTNLLPHMQSLR